MVKWPGAVHEGNGELQIIIDERADSDQHEALRKILYGEETDPGSTVWNVFMSMITTVHDPIYADIDNVSVALPPVGERFPAHAPFRHC